MSDAQASPAKILRSKRAARPKSLRLHGTVARDLGIRIVTGKLQPGELLDGEIAASEQFKVSRTAYREAIRILAAKGLPTNADGQTNGISQWSVQVGFKYEF